LKIFLVFRTHAEKVPKFNDAPARFRRSNPTISNATGPAQLFSHKADYSLSLLRLPHSVHHKAWALPANLQSPPQPQNTPLTPHISNFSLKLSVYSSLQVSTYRNYSEKLEIQMASTSRVDKQSIPEISNIRSHRRGAAEHGTWPYGFHAKR
jgi:hypothetical protein